MILSVLLLLVLLLVFTALGKRILRLTGTKFSSFIEEMVFSFGLGAGVIALLTLGVGLAGGLRRWVFYLLTFGLLGVLILDVKGILMDGIRWLRMEREWMGRFDWALVMILLLHFFLTFICALAPQIEWDSLTHHILVPKIFIQNGRIFNMSPEQGWFVEQSNYPSNMEMLFMLGMLLKSDTVATLVAWSVSIFLALSVYSLTRHFLSQRFSLIAAIIVYCAPMVALFSSYDDVDISVAFFAVLAVYAGMKWGRSRDYRFIAFSGIYAGFCAGTKYTGLPVMFVTALFIFLLGVFEYRKFAAPVKYSLLFLVIALVVASPWYVKNYVYTGNPVYPFLAGIFGGENIPPGYSGHVASTPWRGADDYSHWYRFLLAYIRFPWDLSMSVYKFSPIGPLYLMFIPFLAFTRKVHRQVKLLLLWCLLGLSIIFALAQHPRYMLPFVPPLAVVASYSVYRMSRIDQLIKKIALFLLVVAVFLHITPVLRMTIIRGRAVLGLESVREHLLKQIVNHEAILFINENVPENSRILSVDPRFYYCKRPCVYHSSVIHYGAIGGDEGKLLEELKRLNISHFLMNMEITLFRTNDRLQALYRKLFEQGRLKCIFADPVKGVWLYALRI